MFSGSPDIDKDKDGRYEIDCDSKIFGHILEFLRLEILPKGDDVDAVLNYSEFFGLYELSDKIRKQHGYPSKQMSEDRFW
ncbi:hypothetical protein DPMN_022562 [Dreissena polymorpha]|uniref:Potassium channel tetramerisation-type BTB domain-containing protein n=1 Tax=Dreissena polymorpha TaxID=45954 RepID=A0A9D4SA82_DREPO|nr:hypothetical protein DPMN_022562 [Dreissena polymorpha]